MSHIQYKALYKCLFYFFIGVNCEGCVSRNLVSRKLRGNFLLFYIIRTFSCFTLLACILSCLNKRLLID